MLKHIFQKHCLGQSISNCRDQDQYQDLHCSRPSISRWKSHTRVINHFHSCSIHVLQIIAFQHGNVPTGDGWRISGSRADSRCRRLQNLQLASTRVKSRAKFRNCDGMPLIKLLMHCGIRIIVAYRR